MRLLWLLITAAVLPARGPVAAAPVAPAYAVPLDPARAAAQPAALVPHRPYAGKEILAFVGASGGAQIAADPAQEGLRRALIWFAASRAGGNGKAAAEAKGALYTYAQAIGEPAAAAQAERIRRQVLTTALLVREMRNDRLFGSADEAWVRGMLLAAARATPAGETAALRGSGCHALEQAIGRQVVAGLYPDAPEARLWRAQFNLVWGDWSRLHDVAPNDMEASSRALGAVLLGAHLLDRKETFRDPAMQPVWDRILWEITPDGALPGYGASAAWNGAAGRRIWMLELLAARTGDSRCRWAADRLLGYLQACRDGNIPSAAWPETLEALVLAGLLADDRVVSVPPNGVSRLLLRKETLRLKEDEAAAKYPGALLDGGLDLAERSVPHKMVFRGGWRPGDLYLLVEAFARHRPLNPTAVLAVTASGAALAHADGAGPGNRVALTDLDHLRTPDQEEAEKVRLEYERPMQVTVKPFSDNAMAAHARITVTNYLGYPVDHLREILFVKNRFVLLKDRSAFRQPMHCRWGPVWNARNIGPDTGETWFNSFLESLGGADSVRYANPACDLLVYYAPRADRALKVERAEGLLPFRTQYAWEGSVRQGDLLHSTCVLLPHAPCYPAAMLVGGIHVLADTPDVTVLRREAGDGRTEWVVLNEAGTLIEQGDVVTDAETLYLDTTRGKPTRFIARNASRVSYRGQTLVQYGHRVTVQRYK